MTEGGYAVNHYADDFTDLIPFLNFPNEWSIKILPPQLGCYIRFIIKRDLKEITVSLYRNGIREFYWEITPYPKSYNIYICPIEDSNKLVKAIHRALGNQRIILTEF